MSCLEDKLSILFGKWGKIVSKIPITIIFISLLLAGGFGYFILSIESANNIENLYTPPVCI